MKKKQTISKNKKIQFIENLFKLRSHLALTRGNKRIWGIDISLSNTALSIFHVGKQYYFSRSHKVKGTRYQRLKQIEKSFDEYIEKIPPILAVIENYAYGSKFSREIMGEVGYAVKRCFLVPEKPNQYIPTLLVAPLALKKFVFCESSRGKEKRDIHHIVKIDWEMNTKNHDESDSIVLCIIGQSLFDMCKKVGTFIRGKHMLTRNGISSNDEKLKVYNNITKGLHIAQQNVLIDILSDNIAKKQVIRRKKKIVKVNITDEVGRFYPGIPKTAL